MDLSKVCGALASPFPSGRTRRAAEAFLALAHSGSVVERTFSTWQRPLLATLGYLGAAGADPSRLTIEPRTLARTFFRSLQPMRGARWWR